MRGRIAFRALGCAHCHDLAGEPLDEERPGAQPLVILGGEVTRVASYGELVTSIINPSHEITRRYPRERVSDGDISKMPNFNDLMTVSQLIDLTALLQSKYEVRHEPLYLP